MAVVNPVGLRADKDALTITWSDGVTHRLTWHQLRNSCPCASCKVKRDAPPEPPSPFTILKPEEAQPVKALRLEPLGNYAYHIDFSDGHNTGIYSIEFLRKLGEAG